MSRLFAALPVWVGIISLIASVSVQAQGPAVSVLTSIKPLQLIAAAVQDGVGTPDVLLPPGASPHDYALRPSDVRRVRGAGLFYWIGPDLETFLPKVLAGRTAPSIALQTMPGLQLRYFAADSSSHVESQPDQDNDEHDHDHRPGGLDAHLWLSPVNAHVIAAKMAADLSAADPANANHYRHNLEAFDASLAQAGAGIKARLSAVPSRPFFVFHEAFDYFEDAYGIKHAGVFNLAHDVQPGARHVAEMRKRLQEAAPACVFSEPPLRPALLNTLTRGLPVQLGEMDDLGTANLAVDKDGYRHLLEQLSESLASCFERLKP